MPSFSPFDSSAPVSLPSPAACPPSALGCTYKKEIKFNNYKDNYNYIIIIIIIIII
jgi:hypothetical protein